MDTVALFEHDIFAPAHSANPINSQHVYGFQSVHCIQSPFDLMFERRLPLSVL